MLTRFIDRQIARIQEAMAALDREAFRIECERAKLRRTLAVLEAELEAMEQEAARHA